MYISIAIQIERLAWRSSGTQQYFCTKFWSAKRFRRFSVTPKMIITQIVRSESADCELSESFQLPKLNLPCSTAALIKGSGPESTRYEKKATQNRTPAIIIADCTTSVHITASIPPSSV